MVQNYSPLILSSILYIMLSACVQTSPSKEKTEPFKVEKLEKPIRTIMNQAEPDTLKGSLKAEAHGRIGDVNVKIMYHSPAVRNRVVWGGLVPFDQVWVTGAHSATSLETDQELTIAGKVLPKGKYALFTIPGKKEWIFIINKNWRQHLADDYSVKEDVIRVPVKPVNTQENQERLRYQIKAGSANEGEITLNWDKISVSFPIKL